MSTEKNIFGGDLLEADDFSSQDRGDDIPSLEEAFLNEPENTPAVEEPTEPEAEPSAEPEAEELSAESEGEPSPEDPKTDAEKQLIPRARFNDINDQRKAAENRVRELEARLNQSIPATEYDFDTKEREYMDAVLEGDHAKALGIRKDIRAAEVDLARSVAASQAAKAKDATKAELEFESTVASIEAEYPAFDQTNASYNQELVDEALELHAGFVSRGYSPAAAMRKAVGYVTKINGLEAKGLAKPPAAAPVRTASTVKSKLDLAASQPPTQGGVSGGEVEPDYANLTDDEWAALPQATIARLRGDLM